MVIGCDTIVVLDDKILGKPNDDYQAGEYLKALSGKNALCVFWYSYTRSWHR